MVIIDKKNRAIIERDLLNQLENVGHIGEYYNDLITHYMELVDLKEKLQNDIKKNGLRMEITSGNGIETTKPNESVERLIKVSAQMLKILSELGLKVPTIREKNDDDGL